MSLLASYPQAADLRQQNHAHPQPPSEQLHLALQDLVPARPQTGRSFQGQELIFRLLRLQPHHHQGLGTHENGKIPKGSDVVLCPHQLTRRLSSDMYGKIHQHHLKWEKG